MDRQPLDLAAVRAKLKSQTGKAYWRSLEELAHSEAFQELLQREFPRQAAVWDGQMSRRDFLKLTAAALGLAGLTACASPREPVVPYVERPEQAIPGTPMFYATAMPLGGYALGLLVESHLGRPTKVEGNPVHPASVGGTDAYAQASVLTLYDPDRSQAVTHQGQIRTWDDFNQAVATLLVGLRADGGAGLHILTETVTSPTLAAQLRALLELYPAARWHQYDPINRDNNRAGALLAFGQYVGLRYDFDLADVVVALDADFLACGPGVVRYVHDFTDRRRLYLEPERMNRLYAIESTHTVTGAAADNRLPLRSSDIEAYARALAAALGLDVPVPELPADIPPEWVTAVAEDLLAHRGASVVVPGDTQPPVVHALAHAINATLDNAGRTVIYTDPVEANPVDQANSLRSLVAAMQAGEVSTLLIIGGNPAYTAPADLPFADLLVDVPFSAHLSLYRDETSVLCDWHLPATHYLESWSDVRAYDGTVTVIQPLIFPLYQGRTDHEVLALFAGQAPASAYEIVRGYWESQLTVDDFEAFWRETLHAGVMPGTELPPRPVTLQLDLAALEPQPVDRPGLEIVFRPDPSVYDGSFANNAWLQELPKPIIKLTWDNAALMSPATAERLGVTSESVVVLRHSGGEVLAPVWIMPGHARESVTVHLGYGRPLAGSVGQDAGFNAYRLRGSDAPWFSTGLEVQPTGERFLLAVTQLHHLIEGRPILISGNYNEFLDDPGSVVEDELETPLDTITLYPEYEYEGFRWGMAIDQTTCVGCQACVIACQAENNIPVVGKPQVMNQRIMHWLRVDTYYLGEPDDPQTFFQPVPCMHCEKAPCEPVCPTAATVHSEDGLNDMIYNRCVGTRFCSHNCPYKVRRFNFLQYSDYDTPTLKLLMNPNVTVRTRGVMEKCTYCVQRIRQGVLEAELEDRPVRDGDILTACQAACPAEAIVFGDINDPNSRLNQMKNSPLNYALLAELNTQPRTTYLAGVRNPNPELERRVQG